MITTLLTILPLNLASALSPGILSLTLFLLGAKEHKRSRILALLIGSLVAGIIAIILGFTLSGLADSPGQNRSEAIFDIVLGAFFLIFAIKVIISKERIKQHDKAQSPGFGKWLVIGFIISITNFDAVFLSLTAARETADAEITGFYKLIFVLINLFFFTLPITLPLLITLIAPATSTKVLNKLNGFMLRYSRYIIFAMFATFGIYLLWQGLGFFL